MGYELSHDTLAKQVYNKASTELQTRRKVEKYIHDKFEGLQQRESRMTKDDLDYISPYLASVNINDEERGFVQNEQRRIKRNSTRKWLGVISIIILLTFLSAFAFTKLQLAKEQTGIAQAQTRKAVLSDSLAKESALIAQILADTAYAAKARAEQEALNAKEQASIANLQRRLAEAKTREARTLAVVGFTATFKRDRLRSALKILKELYEKNPIPEVSEVLSNKFHQQFGSNEKPEIRFEAKVFGEYNPYSMGAAAISPNEDMFLSTGSRPILWNWKGEKLAELGTTEPAEGYFLPGGKKILILDEDERSLDLYSVQGEYLHSFNHSSLQYINSVVFSPDSTYLLTASDDKTAILWSLDGEVVTRFLGHTDRVTFATFLPSGEFVLTQSRDSTARLWNLEGKELKKIKSSYRELPWLQLSPNGTHLLSKENKHWTLLNLDGVALKQFQGTNYYDFEMQFTPDGSHLISWEIDTIIYWSLQGEEIWRVDQVGNPKSMRPYLYDGITKVVFSPDKNKFLTVSQDHIMRLYNMAGKTLAMFQGHEASINEAIFMPDGQHIFSGAFDGNSYLWNLEGRPVIDFKGHQLANIFWSAYPSKSGRKLLTNASEGLLLYWDLDKKPLVEFGKEAYKVKAAQFSVDGLQIAIGCDDNKVRVYDLFGHQLNTISGQLATDWQQGSNKDFVLDQNKILDFDGNPITELTQFSKEKPERMAFSRDGKMIAVIKKYQNRVDLYDGDGNAIGEVSTEQLGLGRINRLEFSDRGEVLFIQKNYSSILITLEGESIARFSGYLHHYDLSPDGQFIAGTSSREDSTVTIWHADGKVLTELIGHQGAITDMVFSPDGRRILTASADNNTILWDLRGTIVSTFRGHIQEVSTVAFSPDGQFVLTSSQDYSANLWNLQGESLAELTGHDVPVVKAIFSPDGKRVLTIAEDKTARIWFTPDYIYEYLTTELPLRPLSPEEKKRYRLDF